MYKQEAYEVIIAGAGPVGLSLGLGLARAGRSVLLLEKNSSTSEHSRAPLIWPRTLEILAGLGVISRFREEGILLTEVELTDAGRGRTLLHLPFKELQSETDFPELLICPQSQTERLLCEALRETPSATLLFSAEVRGIDQNGKQVKVQYEHHGEMRTAIAPFAAGCDGAHSTVREALGLSFEGMTYQMKAALADIELEEDEDFPFPRMSRRQGLATALRLNSSLWRIIVPRQREEDISVEQHIERAVDSLFPNGSYRTAWQSEFNLHRRLSSQFVKGRIALAGDAAHLRSPVGGEGMNLGIQDTEALKRALITALDEDSPEPLKNYASQRQKAVQSGVARITDWLTKNMLSGRPEWVVPAFRAAGYLLRFGPLRRMVMRRLAMLDDPSR